METCAFPVGAPPALIRVYEGGGDLFRDPLTFSDDSGSSGGAGSQKPGQAQQQKVVTSLCPVPTFVSLWTMRANGLPIDLSSQVQGASMTPPSVLAACSRHAPGLTACLPPLPACIHCLP